jgi:hypothetical protein
MQEGQNGSTNEGRTEKEITYRRQRGRELEKKEKVVKKSGREGGNFMGDVWYIGIFK